MSRSTRNMGIVSIIAGLAFTGLVACSAGDDNPNSGGAAGAPAASGGAGGAGGVGGAGGTGGVGAGGVPQCPAGFTPPTGKSCEPNDSVHCQGYFYPFVEVLCICPQVDNDALQQKAGQYWCQL